VIIKKHALHSFQIIVSTLGLILSLYLLVQHTRLKAGIQDKDGFCHIGEGFDCNSVNASAFSEIVGIPIAALGALFFFTLLILVAFHPPESRYYRKTQIITARLSTLALGIDLILFGLQYFVIRKFCLFCLFITT
jgi:uncharacterized membrane protein